MKYTDIIIKLFIKLSLIFISFIGFLTAFFLTTLSIQNYYQGQSYIIDGITNLFFWVFVYIPIFGWYVIVPIVFNIYYINKKEKIDFNIISIVIHSLILCYVSLWWITGQKVLNRMF
jgi:hypothetical protein